MDIKQRISDLIVISNNFADIVEMENKALKDHDSKAVQELFERKDALSRAYETRMKGFNQLPPEEIAGIDEELKEHLLVAGKKLAVAIDENATLLQISMNVHKKMIDAIADAVREATPSAGTYGANGTTGIQNGYGSPKSASLSLNETL